MKVYFLLVFLQILCVFSLIPDDARLGVFCDGKISDPNIYMSANEINSLCNKISLDNRYMVSIKKTLNSKFDAEFTRDTESRFVLDCKKYYNFCSNLINLRNFIKNIYSIL